MPRKQNIVSLLFIFFIIGCQTDYDNEEVTLKGFDTFWENVEKPFPIDIVILKEAQAARIETSLIEDALIEWNDVLGAQYFNEKIVENYSKHKTCNKIYFDFVEQHVLPNNSTGGEIMVIYNCYLYIRLTNDLRRPGSYGILYNVILHELGHSLGLNHNEDTNSIMYETAINESQSIADEDIEIVHAVYPISD